ncbi:hypothetical protein [Actinophytocola sp. NPDC049390]|uniref:hypothetical protein n=1 Tax=Actinophytocola sp. NPDC049390 TaxID=3363894 RepID=UPI0037AD70E1
MSVVVLVLFFAAVAAAIGLLVTMFARDRPFYGVVALGLLAGPGAVLAFLHLAVAQG